MSARTVIEHALRVYYADDRDPAGFVEKLLAKHDADVHAAALDDAAGVAVRAARGCGDSETGQYAASVAAGIGKELRGMAAEIAARGSEKGTRGSAPQQGESTHQPPRPHALPESSFARARKRERIGGFFRCARLGRASAEEQRGVV